MSARPKADVLRGRSASDAGGGSARVLPALTILMASCVAALLTHIGIDIAGDFVLAHDPYDDLQHASRFTIAALGLASALTLLVSIFYLALLEARDGRSSLRRAVVAATGSSPWPSIVAVNCLALPMLAGMGAVDALLAGERVSSLVEMVGGSLTLWLCVAMPTASLLALTTWLGMRRLLRSLRTLVAAVGVIISLLKGPHEARLAISFEPALAHRARLTPIIGGNAGKRGPPAPG